MYVFASGQRYEGAWSAGKKHGWSIYTVETGEHGRSQDYRPAGGRQPWALKRAAPGCLAYA